MGMVWYLYLSDTPVYNPDIPNDTAHRSYERQGIDRVSEIHEGDRLPPAGRKSRE
ncbi:hypothetical protein [Roseburia faecis]|uniref:hypothetical protein n=1 Tax=Roseburia faecis TaxID=301302 RepID=UPI0018995625|nr:hypothetical protein [Roseburia faecis]